VLNILLILNAVICKKHAESTADPVGRKRPTVETFDITEYISGEK
jgi:hypothetical protein